jgi:hypothetical protein
MKAVTRLLVVSVVLATILVPLTLFADQLPIPLDKKLSPGVTDVTYAGQTLRFSTPVPLVIRFEPQTITQIKLTVRAYGSPAGGAQGVSGGQLSIYWQNWDTDVYSGPPPSADWEGILNTESGFTEK